MCGISGFIDFKRLSDSSTLRKMSDTLYHRGPDGDGIELIQHNKATVGLAHRRLSIIDLSDAGKQPMTYNNMYITFNGEVYNFREIKNELESIGHQFQSHSDTEVVLHAYAEWGANAVKKFIGMFAFVILDNRNNEVFICRDRAGIKPFFYYWHNDLFLFGSELKALMAHESFEKKINIDAVSAFLQYGYVPNPNCIFEHTHKLSPASHITINLENR